MKMGAVLEVHSSLLQRKIIHVDMDCFYAAVEARDNPSLRGKPLIVGGSPEKRGVVATCSYEARKFGVRSAMASALAKRLCPEAIFISSNFEKYRAESSLIRDIFYRYTPLVEPVSLDEAYLDVTDHDLYATKIALKIREEILSQTGLTASAGVGPNKLVAKIASDFNKPNGIKVVTPGEVSAFMSPLGLRKINGVGPATERRLQAIGLRTCSDVLKLGFDALIAQLGDRMGRWLFERCSGIDERPVSIHRERKSLGSERTFAKDLSHRADICTELKEISSRVAAQLKAKQLLAKTITLKIKYSDFKQITRSQSINLGTNSLENILNIANKLMDKTEVLQKPVRLIGVSLSNFEPEKLLGGIGISH